MAWLKLARLCQTPDHEDSYVDAAAYIALAGEMAEQETYEVSEEAAENEAADYAVARIIATDGELKRA